MNGPSARTADVAALAAALAAALGVVGIVMACFAVTSGWLALVVEGVVLAALFAWRPKLGLLLTVASIPFAFAIRQIGGAQVSANDLVLLATAVSFAARAVEAKVQLTPARPAPRWEGGFRGIDLAVGFFLLVCVLSLLVGEDKRSALWELRVLVLQPVVLYGLVRTEPLSGNDLLRVGDALVAGATVLAAAGLVYYFGLHYVEAAEGVRRLLIPFYDSPNHISLFLERAAPVALAIAVYGRGRLRRPLHAAALAAMLLAIYLTYSRGAWLIGLPAALLFVLLLPQLTERRRPWIWLAAAAVVVAGLLVLLPVARTARFASLLQPESGTTMLRFLLWKGAWRLIEAHPLTGAGIGNFAIQYPHYMLPEAWREPLVFHPHNLLLDFWAILGLPGLVALIWLLVAFWREAVRSYRRPIDPALRALLVGLLGSMVGFLTHGVVDTAYFLPDLALVFMLTLALIKRLSGR